MKTICFLPKIRNKTKDIFFSPLIFNKVLETLAIVIDKEKNANCRGEKNKIASICRCRKFKEIYIKILELTSEFSKNSWYKNYIHKSQSHFYKLTMNIWKVKLKNTIVLKEDKILKYTLNEIYIEFTCWKLQSVEKN